MLHSYCKVSFVTAVILKFCMFYWTIIFICHTQRSKVSNISLISVVEILYETGFLDENQNSQVLPTLIHNWVLNVLFLLIQFWSVIYYCSNIWLQDLQAKEHQLLTSELVKRTDASNHSDEQDLSSGMICLFFFDAIYCQSCLRKA